MKTETLLKRMQKDKDVLFVGSAEQCERTADELFELARAKGLSPGKQGAFVRLYEARGEGEPSEAVASVEFAPLPRGRSAKVVRLKQGEFPVAVPEDLSVIVAGDVG